MKKKLGNINFLILLLLSLIITGVIGYKSLLNLSLIDALYMTVITISTVGYGEIVAMDTEAKLFSIMLIFVSLGTVGYLFSSIVSSLLEGDIRKAWRRRKMESIIDNMREHYIVCGAGETGYNAIKKLIEGNVPFVVIDKDIDKVNSLKDEKIPAILGDATHEDILEKANIIHSKGLISSLSTDSENVYTVLTARQMNKNLYIVSRAINKHADEKLKRAGANNTISPNEIGGSRMASLMLRPHVISFLDVITKAGDVILDLEEVHIRLGSLLIDKSLVEAKIPEKTGLIVLAIKKGNSEELSFNPSSYEILEEGDIMVVLGEEEQVNNLREMANDL